MLTLPSISYAMQKNRKEIVAMRGINYSDQLQDGDMANSLNLSARRYPYITTRKARVKQEAYADVTALTAWDKLVAVRGTDLLYDGAVVGQVTEGEKQFAVVNTRLVIWPDKVYLDLNTSTVKPLGASLSGAGATFTNSTMTIAWQLDGEAVDLTEYFKAGDAVTITGCTTQEANNKDIVIKEITATTVTVTENGFVEATESGAEIKLERTIPELDFICESQNRLWGVSSEKQTIYASSLGDPTNFNVFEGLSTDSYALAVGSEGNFTGCCKLSSSVLFWKETKLHKILGNYPAEYSLYTYDIEGLQYNEAQTLKAKFPNFDLKAELQDPNFRASIQAGVSMEQTYKGKYFDQFMGEAQKATAAATEKNLVNNIRAKGQRPAENGANSQSASFTTKSDPSKLTLADFEEIARRVAHGEVISF